MTDQIVEMPVVTTSEPVAVPSSPLRAQYDVWVATMADIRAVNPGIIAPALGTVELFEIITGDSNLMKRHAAIFSEIRDSSDADKKEMLAREVFLIDCDLN